MISLFKHLNKQNLIKSNYYKNILNYGTSSSSGRDKKEYIDNKNTHPKSDRASSRDKYVLYNENEKNDIEIREFIKSQAISGSKSGDVQFAEAKPMNRSQKRKMQFKLFRNPENIVVAGQVSPRSIVPSHIDLPPYAKGEEVIDMELDDDIEIHSEQSIQSMRESCKLAKEILEYASTLIKPGLTTDELDKLVHQEIINRGAYPSPLGYKGFPKSICTSINEVLCHGIPDSRPLCQGDIISVDITVYYKGYHGDTCATFIVGGTTNDLAATKLLEISKKAMEAGIKAVKPGRPFSDIGKAIQTYVHQHSFSLPPDFTGHGIGKVFHSTPFVFHCVNDLEYIMKPGMIFTVEPIVVESTNPYTEWKMWDDNWTISSTEGGWASQFEHTVLVTQDGVEILTK
ncbi:methionine aminopeptidase [Tieghemostelium lacteum]|uniref:Methionine aminopeptidase n=1 Tax=Tieghemostelium lacteum TaxID=361077 RepID=A0A151ZDI9_TIELA|nr:methionine aminopeptidase [Tieghemostelium lacteum]|eukprot:KYQ92023.1 methionine aminopeptidase [Tieghemostelium lacteum]